MENTARGIIRLFYISSPSTGGLESTFINDLGKINFGKKIEVHFLKVNSNGTYSNPQEIPPIGSNDISHFVFRGHGGSDGTILGMRKSADTIIPLVNCLTNQFIISQSESCRWAAHQSIHLMFITSCYAGQNINENGLITTPNIKIIAPLESFQTQEMKFFVKGEEKRYTVKENLLHKGRVRVKLGLNKSFWTVR